MSTEFPETLTINIIPIDIQTAHKIRERFRRWDYTSSESMTYSRAESCPMSQAIKREYGFDEVVTGIGGHITVGNGIDYAEYFTDGIGADFIMRADVTDDNVSPILCQAERMKISERAPHTN